MLNVFQYKIYLKKYKNVNSLGIFLVNSSDYYFDYFL